MKKHITLVLFLLVAILPLASCGCQGYTHFPLAAVIENRIEATCTKEGSYDSVVYCTVCKTEFSRNKITVPKTEHNYVGGVCTNCRELDPSYGYSIGLEFTSNGDGTCSVSRKGSCTDTDIVIPPVSPDGDSVTSIGNSAFYNCSSLTSIVIPDSVTSIGRGAFHDCSSLESVVIGDSVTSIGSFAFEGCTSLTSIEIPDSVTSIGYDAFSYCSSLKSVVIGDSVTSIGDYAFHGCSSLNAVHISDIAKWCQISFYDYDANPLCYAHNLYLNNELVTELVIPDSVTSIGAYAFSSCSSLESIVIGDSVTRIGDSAFRNCSSLKSVVIGNSVTSIGEDAFYGCYKLDDVYISDVEAWMNISFGNYYSRPNYNGNLHILDENGNEITELVIPEGVTSIGEAAFRGCSSLTSIEIGDGVTSIGWHAFYCCSSLTSLVIPDSVTSIGNYAFAYCSSLTSVVIPDSVTSIGSSAFDGCSSLTSIAIPDSVTSIGDHAFIGCSSLTSIEIGDGVTIIGEDAFSYCISLTSIVIPDSVTSIGDYAFYNCSSLTNISVDENNQYYKSIDGNLYSKDGKTLIQYAIGKSDTSFAIPDSVTSIGEYAFAYSLLTSIVIPDSVESIGDYAFYKCSTLKSVVIPDSVTSIGNWAFSGCPSLTDVYYTGTEEEWASIGISPSNSYLTGATIHYNYVPEE